MEDSGWKMEDRGPFRPRSKLIVIKEGTPEETKRKAFESYFTLTGSTELMPSLGVQVRGGEFHGIRDGEVVGS